MYKEDLFGVNDIRRWVWFACLVCCLLLSVFAVVGSGVAFGMKRSDVGGERKVSEVMQRFLGAVNRDHLFLNELNNSERGKVLKNISGREGARLLGLVDDEKEFERLWGNFMSRGVREGVWPHLSQQTIQFIVGDGKALQGFIDNSEKLRLQQAKARFEEGLPRLFPVGRDSGGVVFQGVARFLDGGGWCRLLLVCDGVWPKGREWIANKVQAAHKKAGGSVFERFGEVKETSGHWVEWVKVGAQEQPGLFERFSDSEAFEVWNAASLNSKNELWSKLQRGQRLRVLGFEGGLFGQIMDGVFGEQAKGAVLDSDRFVDVLNQALRRMNVEQKLAFLKVLKNYPGLAERYCGVGALQAGFRLQKGGFWNLLAKYLPSTSDRVSLYRALPVGDRKYIPVRERERIVSFAQLWVSRQNLKLGSISTIAGAGQQGFSGDNGQVTNAQITGLAGVFVSGDGHLYIADWENHHVRRVSPEGVISTIAGTDEEGLSGGHGLGINAELSGSVGIFVSGDSHLYIADNENHRLRVMSLDEDSEKSDDN